MLTAETTDDLNTLTDEIRALLDELGKSEEGNASG
jgi:hypothetical protein